MLELCSFCWKSYY